jgi:hypothetical protein
VQLHRKRGVHVTPTVFLNGYVSSGVPPSLVYVRCVTVVDMYRSIFFTCMASIVDFVCVRVRAERSVFFYCHY